MTKLANVKPVDRTSAGLRDALFDELDALRAGHTNPAQANATAKLTSGIIDTVRMEIDVQKHLAKHSGHDTKKLAELNMPVALGVNVGA
jgi:hypothetical protein